MIDALDFNDLLILFIIGEVLVIAVVAVLLVIFFR